jgi:pimeloyl-ACP methyl ester carboxylesterase
MTPVTRYARNGDVNLAYQVTGDGPLDVLFLPGLISHVEALWEEPGLQRFFERLGRFCRIVLMDRRGSGMSDQGDLALASEVEDVTAVLDAAGSERAALFAYTTGGQLAAAYAAHHPERIGALVLYACTLLAVGDEDLPWAQSAAEREQRFEALLANWGRGTNLDLLAPSAADDPRLRDWLARLERQAASPDPVEGADPGHQGFALSIGSRSVAGGANAASTHSASRALGA